MKNLSELMVDLAYSAILFNSKAAAEEVIALENEVNAMNYEIKKESLVAARSYEDAEKLTALLEIAEAAESIANAAKVDDTSDIANNSLGDLLLVNRTGMRVIAIRRGTSWIYGPDKHTTILPNDTLILKGTEAGADLLEKLAAGACSLEDIPEELEDED